MNNIDLKTIRQIRLLSAQTIQKANSGHPGLPLGAAPIAYALFHNIMNYSPQHPHWINRDRFVLSAGHGSALLYTMLHLYGYNVSLNDLKDFRQIGSRTPGHPEYMCLPGVDTTTGPLGAGFSNAVGMALAERRLRTLFGKEIVDNYIYVLSSDGDFMEGITQEAASFAGNQKLDKLVVLYDSNKISIEGNTDVTFTEDVAARFKAMNWYVDDIDGSDPDIITDAVKHSREAGSGMPKLIICRTTIGQDAGEKEGTAKVHGAPLGDKIIADMKEKYGWTEDFFVDPEVEQHISNRLNVLDDIYETWEKRSYQLRSENQELAKLYGTFTKKSLPEIDYPVWETGTKEATRKSSGKVLNAIAKATPTLIGGSADLAPSNATWLNDFPVLSAETQDGRNIHFGIREHAMGGIVNGIALYGGHIPFGATFLVFSDYMRGAVRLSALMEIKTIWIFTHDSFFVGEDGPTHQPVEHLDSLRLIPNLKVIRPADGNETVAAYKFALKHDGPTAILLTRQGLPQLAESSRDPDSLRGYIVHKTENAKIQLYASGSEVSLALRASDILKREGLETEVISVPMLDLQDTVKLRGLAEENSDKLKIAIEAGTTRLFAAFGIPHRIGLNRFGASGPAEMVASYLKYTPDAVADRIKEIWSSIK